MHQLYTAVFEPGFFGSPQVHIAVTVGAVVAIVSAVTGVYTVLRGQSFGGPSLGDASAARGSAAPPLGFSPPPRVVGLGIVGAARMGLHRLQRAAGPGP